MTDDVRIAVGLPTHPKTKKLKHRLGEAGCWSLICLWLWVGDRRWTGELTGLSDEDIEIIADWNGESGAFVETLIAVRFLEGDPGARRIHEWAEHNPFAAKKGERIARSKRAADVRWGKVVKGMPAACDEHASGMNEHCPPTPTPTLTPPVHALRARADALGFEVSVEAQSRVLAAVLADAGMPVMCDDEKVVAIAQEGISVEHLREIVALERNKPTDYVLDLALRQVREMRKRFPGHAAALFDPEFAA